MQAIPTFKGREREREQMKKKLPVKPDNFPMCSFPPENIQLMTLRMNCRQEIKTGFQTIDYKFLTKKLNQ